MTPTAPNKTAIVLIDCPDRKGIVAVVSDFLWTLGPHLHFADFTSRLTFSWGALPLTPFLNVSLYFCGLLLLGSLCALRLWKYRSE